MQKCVFFFRDVVARSRVESCGVCLISARRSKRSSIRSTRRSLARFVRRAVSDASIARADRTRCRVSDAGFLFRDCPSIRRVTTPPPSPKIRFYFPHRKKRKDRVASVAPVSCARRCIGEASWTTPMYLTLLIDQWLFKYSTKWPSGLRRRIKDCVA